MKKNRAGKLPSLSLRLLVRFTAGTGHGSSTKGSPSIDSAGLQIPVHFVVGTGRLCWIDDLRIQARLQAEYNVPTIIEYQSIALARRVKGPEKSILKMANRLNLHLCLDLEKECLALSLPS